MDRFGWAVRVSAAGPRRVGCFAFLGVLVALPCFGEFALAESTTGVTVLEDGAPVLTYNFGRIEPPAGVDVDRYWRSSYVHPLYGPDGAAITEDFPRDHYHHRGVFWTWPETQVGERKMDVWTIVGARQLFQRWINKAASAERAVIEVENAWFFDDDPEAKVRETVAITVHAAADDARAIDFRLRFENVTDEDVAFLGAENKGYGGFSFRPIADNRPFTFLTATGISEKDALRYETPWASIRWQADDSAEPAGAAIFQHPSNPGYPHPGWIFRHYGFLGASWPHEVTHTLEPGASFTLRYRLLIYAGAPEVGELNAIHDAYAASRE